ncbi:MAG TPA: sigma-70 family RNA polymerase sigma factor [Verrucomicrobiota bacterium]|nr:sigma-70 family RNA polymerase sigma factor [Verrucomicrobiota bacterium]
MNAAQSVGSVQTSVPISPEQCPDDWLVVRCQARDEDAFRELVRRWEPRLYYYLRRLLEDESAVWDVLQNTWLAVFRHVSRLEDVPKFRSWVYRIAHDQAVTWLQKEKRYWYQPNEQIEPMVNHEDWVLAPTDDGVLMHQALQRLSPHCREVLTLFYLEGFTSRQIAEIVGLPEGTIKSRLHNARKDLAAALKEVGYER